MQVKGSTELATDQDLATDVLVEELFDLWRWLRHVSYSIREGEATAQQFWLLHQLGRRGSMTVGEVGEALGISQSSATIACKRLEVSGLVARARRTSDERVVEIKLTGEGRDKVDSWRVRRRQALSELLKQLEPYERDEMIRLVGRLLSLAEPTSAVPAE